MTLLVPYLPPTHTLITFRQQNLRIMPNLTVAVLGQPGFAKDLGKTGTVSDITLYNMKRGDVSVTFIEPTRYPEKIAPLFFAVSTADKAITVVDEVNAAFGETVLMLQCAGIIQGTLRRWWGKPRNGKQM